MKLHEGVVASAQLSADGVYRYTLTRDWDVPKPAPRHVLWVMLNPSTADADVDDWTIRRCQAYARAWGFDGITVANLFAFRATDPKELYGAPFPVGEVVDGVDLNDETLRRLLQDPHVEMVVAAWGKHGRYLRRHSEFATMAMHADRTVHVLKFAAGGVPHHPRGCADDLTPKVWLEGSR